MITITDLRFDNRGAVLAGSLYRPAGAVRPPVVIVLHPAQGGSRSYPFFRHLTERLPAAGIAVFAYDRRGSGESSGVFATADFELLAADGQAASDALRQSETVDAGRMVFYGVSQGGWIAPLTARRVPETAGLVIVSGSGVSPAEQMAYSARFALRRAGFSEDVVARAMALRARVDDYYRGRVPRLAVQAEIDRVVDQAWFAKAYIDRVLAEDVRADKWYYEMDYDPLPVWQSLNRPALFLYAQQDEWVPIEESIRRYRAVTAHLPGVEFHRVPATDHLMAPPGAQPDSGLVSEEYLSILLAWLRQVFVMEA